MKNKILIVLLSLALTNRVIGQDVHFTMFNLSPMIFNPGAAGSESEMRALLNYRNQWSSVASPYQTIAGSFDMQFGKSKDGFWAGGIQFYNDKAGDAKMGITQGNLNAAYHVIIARGQTLGVGVMGGYSQRSVSMDVLMWGNQYDGMAFNSGLPTGEPGSGNLTKGFMDAGAGIVWTYGSDEKYITGNDHIMANFGLGVLHVHQPDMSFFGTIQDRLYRKYVFHAYGLIGVGNTRISFAPGLMTAFQGPAREILIGSNIRYRLQEDSHFTGFVTGSSLSLGMWYRNKDAVAMTAMIQYGGYGIGFTYDLNISDLAQASSGRGGFELALKWFYPSGNAKGKTSRFL